MHLSSVWIQYQYDEGRLLHFLLYGPLYSQKKLHRNSLFVLCMSSTSLWRRPPHCLLYWPIYCPEKPGLNRFFNDYHRHLSCVWIEHHYDEGRPPHCLVYLPLCCREKTYVNSPNDHYMHLFCVWIQHQYDEGRPPHCLLYRPL